MIMNGLSQGGGSDSRVPVIYTTSYVGTGAGTNSSNPVVLTFDFIPEFVYISRNYNSSQGYDQVYPIGLNKKATATENIKKWGVVSGSGYSIDTNIIYSTFENNTIKFYGKSSGTQYSYCYSGYTYNVLAIGYKEES